MNPHATLPTRFIGCDVGKTSIVVFDSRDGRTRTIPNRDAELALLAAELDDTCLVVCEATGGHEDRLLDALLRHGRPVHRADARKVKAFIRSFGTLGKSDGIDAHGLSLYGQERHVRLARWQEPDPHRDRLQALVLARSDLVAQRLAFANRRDAPGAEPVRPYLEPLIAAFEAQIAAIEAAIESVIAEHAALRRDARTLRAIAGIGQKTAAALLALLPELGRLDRRKIAALAGLAPHPNQSGGKDKYRPTRGGRPEVKRVLFMAALSAAQHHKTLRPAYEALVARGKKPIVALTAIMRRLLVIANAKLRDANPANPPDPIAP